MTKRKAAVPRKRACRMFNYVLLLCGINVCALRGVTSLKLNATAAFPYDIFQCRPCGLWRTDRVASDNPEERTRHRIIGGSSVESGRPWMVYLEVKGTSGKFHCGGAIINLRYIITAAHCICDQLPCLTNNQGSMEPDFEISKHLIAYVGISNVKDRNSSKAVKYIITHALIHQLYKSEAYDLALLKVEKPMRFSTRVMPICMPLGPAFPDIDESPGASEARKTEAYVAGWGNVRNPVCNTDLFGPTPLTQCAFPFAWEGRTYSKCLKSKTPSSKDRLCQKYVNSDQGDPMKSRGSNMVIYDDQTGLMLSHCYTQEDLENGWCATCQINATSAADQNYCAPEDNSLANQTDSEKKLAEPGLSSLWGICQPDCDKNISITTKQLQEIKLEILQRQQCTEFFRSLGAQYDLEREICAGKVNSRSMKAVRFNSKDGKFRSDPDQSKQFVTETFVGGGDSCLGDSGGPMWRIFGRKQPAAILIGIVSRGMNCANKNSPGIYTRIKKFMQWINENAIEGKCTTRKLLNQTDI